MKTRYANAILTITALAMLAFAGCTSQKSDAKKQYTCEMHPEVVSDHPGKCPKCNMDLTEKK